MSNKNTKIGITSLVLLLALGGLFYTTLSEGTEYYKHVDEVMEAPDQRYGKRLQLHGFVEKGSILVKKGHARLQVQYRQQRRRGAPRPTGASCRTRSSPDAEVVVKGTLGPHGFTVEPNGVMAKCPSKYEASGGGAAPKAAPGAAKSSGMY